MHPERLSGDRVGYLLKDRISNVSELPDAVRRVAGGEVVIDPQVIGSLLRRRRVQNRLDELTEEEPVILALMAEGLSDQAIGERSGLSRDAVEAHIASILSKLELKEADGTHSRVQAVLAYLQA